MLTDYDIKNLTQYDFMSLLTFLFSKDEKIKDDAEYIVRDLTHTRGSFSVEEIEQEAIEFLANFLFELKNKIYKV